MNEYRAAANKVSDSLKGLSELIANGKQRVELAFLNLLDSEINISTDLRSEASVSQKRIRDIITTENSRDSTFPAILKIQDNDFLGGSFARHTKISPLDDIDVYFPIDGATLTFTDSEKSFLVISDGILNNPMSDAKWDKGSGKISSKKLVAGFADLLKTRYPNSQVRADGQAVTIRLSSIAVGSQKDPGLGFDVVPCFLIRPSDSVQENFYVIADGKDDWVRTNPRVDQDIGELIHNVHNKTFRPVVKLIKYWNTKYFQDKIKSYFIELVIAKAYIEKGAGVKIGSIQEGLVLGFEAVSSSVNSKLSQSSWVKKAPPVDAGDTITDVDRLNLYLKSLAASKAWKTYNNLEFTKAIEEWSELFPELANG